MAVTALCEAAPEPSSVRLSAEWSASSPCDSARASLHRSNIVLQDFVRTMANRRIRSRTDNCVLGPSARLRSLLDVALDTANEHDLGVVLQRIVDRAAWEARAISAVLEVFDDDGLTVVARFAGGITDVRGVDVAPFFEVHIERGPRCYGRLVVVHSPGGTPSLDEALIRALASLAACVIESAELMASERVCADVAADRTADHVLQHAAQELFAAVAAAQDDERAELSRRLCNEVGYALDSVLVGLHRISAPRDSRVEIPAMQDPIDELRDVIGEAICRTRRMAFELRSPPPTESAESGARREPGMVRSATG